VKRKHTAKPIAGGILGIIAGVLGSVVGIILIADGATPEFPWQSVDWTTVGLGIALVVFGIAAIAGLSFAVARKNFTLATVGGVCALVAVWPLGIPALILIVMSRGEFQPASSSLICINCGKENPNGGRFCSSCGRELPGH
jgi:heme/copper-type cytochrome/quinol oxidase subunit 2